MGHPYGGSNVQPLVLDQRRVVGAFSPNQHPNHRGDSPIQVIANDEAHTPVRIGTGLRSFRPWLFQVGRNGSTSLLQRLAHALLDGLELPCARDLPCPGQHPLAIG